MKNTLIIILLILLILAGAWYVFKPVPKSENEIALEAKSKALKDSVKTLQSLYYLEGLKNKRLTAELLKSKAVVKRSEDQLNKAKANEKVYLKRIKEQTLAMSEIQADSAINSRYQSDPDSIPQKVVMELGKLDQCDIVRAAQDSTIHSMREYFLKVDQHSLNQQKMLELSRDQIDLLSSSSQIDKQLLQIKDKENKKLRRGKRLAIVAVPVAFLIGLFLTQ